MNTFNWILKATRENFETDNILEGEEETLISSKVGKGFKLHGEC
jgi:hypothetical protein